MPVIYSRPRPGTVGGGGGAGGEPVFLNISEPPSPAERNCVIMPDFFYDSNQAHCLCKRAARLCSSRTTRGGGVFTPPAENESTATEPGALRWMQSCRNDCCYSLPPCKHQPPLSAIRAKQTRRRRTGHLLVRGHEPGACWRPRSSKHIEAVC